MLEYGSMQFGLGQIKDSQLKLFINWIQLDLISQRGSLFKLKLLSGVWMVSIRDISEQVIFYGDGVLIFS